jgi:glycosyltransferase involved in cell wall biosynthesis
MKQLIRDTVVIIPAYNEAEIIAKTLRGVLQSFKYCVVVNDGSSDDTSARARDAGAVVVDHFINGVGQGGALQTGIEYSLGLPVSYFVTFDADGQHQVKDVIKMRTVMQKAKPDIVIGSRFLGVESKNMPSSKKLLLKAAIKFSNLTSGLKLTDAHNGLRMFNRKVAEKLDIQDTGYGHASEITEKIAKYKWVYKEVPIEVIYSDYSIGKGQSMLNALNIASDILARKVVRK